MKTCPKCNASIVDTAKFCSKCGVNIKKYEEEKASNRFCPECGTEMSGGDFCTECGFQVNAAADAEAVTAEPTLGNAAVNEKSAEPVADFGYQTKAALDVFEYEDHFDGTYTIICAKNKTALTYNVPQGVVAIADNAFEGSSAIKVTLPSSILHIGNAAFKACKNLVSINLPESIMIVGDEAFADCELLDVKLPESVLKVGKDVLKNTAPDKKKSEDEIKELNLKLAKCEIGGTVTFGSYWKKDIKEPTVWTVLTREAENVLLISRDIITMKEYNEANADVTWELCTLRKWLNGEFIQQAFNSAEQAKLQVTTVRTADVSIYDSGWYNTKGGNDTKDRVFLLSYEEANRYFTSDTARKSVLTPYAKSHNSVLGNIWWLRSPGSCQNVAQYIRDDGTIWSSGIYVNYIYGVRPAMWVKVED